jgi:putative flippase GtrA
MEARAPAVTLPSLLTPSTLATLGGLATAVVIIVDSVHSATGWTSAWFALVLAIALALVVEFALSQSSVGRPRVARVALALVNGCLVYTTALGGNQVGHQATTALQAEQPRTSLRSSSSPAPIPDRAFFHDWHR